MEKTIVRITYKEEIIKESKHEETKNNPQTEDFFDDENRVDSFEAWQEKREKWKAVELPRRKGLDLYNNIFSYTLI